MNEPEPEVGSEPELITRWVTTSMEEANRADNLLRQAHITKTRGEVERASHLVAEVYQQAPYYPPAVLAYVDELLSRGKAGDAIRILEGAIASSPPSLALEDKRAELVLRTRYRESDYFDPADAKENYASAKTAVALSIMLPGLGHMANEKFVKGGVLMAMWIVGVGGVFLVPDGLKGLGGLLDRHIHAPFNPLVLVPLLLALTALAIAVAETSMTAKKATTIRPEHPVPPVDKPF
ncbi:MAG: hypothetical protein ABUL72_02290 [Armatimonadota bacterium]